MRGPTPTVRCLRRAPFGSVFDYRQPDRSRVSKNIGDYVQTLALLGNLARFPHVEFTLLAALADLLADLQSRGRPALPYWFLS